MPLPGGGLDIGPRDLSIAVLVSWQKGVDCGEVKGQGGQSCAVKSDRNKMGTFNDITSV